MLTEVCHNYATQNSTEILLQLLIISKILYARTGSNSQSRPQLNLDELLSISYLIYIPLKKPKRRMR